jgi:signal transduction histidine kinase
MTPQSPDDEAARLMYSFAHDLRGYLRTMRTRIQLVQAGASVLAEQEANWLAEAGTAAEDMGRLIGAMVSYCSVVPASETMRLGLMLRGLRLEVKSILAEAAAELSIAEEADVEVARSLSVVLQELLTNSCRFRRQDIKTKIRIGTRMPDPRTLELVVTDNGTGVGSEYLDKIFQPFRRMHSRSDYPGFGLGLALCRRIVAANGGSIDASAPAEGGLAIRILMPAKAVS